MEVFWLVAQGNDKREYFLTFVENSLS